MKDFLEVLEESDKLTAGSGQRARGIANFKEKLDRFVRLIANIGPEGQHGWDKPHVREYKMKEAETTSDFPILFGTVLERQLLAEYTAASPDWRTYIKAGTQNDFRASDLIGVYGLQAGLAEVPQRGEYKNDKLRDGKVSISLKKYGKQFQLSWEALINDDLGAFSDCATRLSQAALRTEYREATKLFAASTGPHASLFGNALANPIDAVVVDNLTGLAFDEAGTALQFVITKLRKMVDVDGEPILIDGFDLVVPPDLEISMMKALAGESLIGFGGDGNTVTTSRNVTKDLGITGHVNQYLPIIDTTSGTTAWYVFARGARPAAQLNFLRGHESPEIVQRNSNKVALGGGPVPQSEGDFESDSMAWRVRHVLGGTQVDNRACFASDGTGSGS